MVWHTQGIPVSAVDWQQLQTARIWDQFNCLPLQVLDCLPCSCHLSLTMHFLVACSNHLRRNLLKKVAIFDQKCSYRSKIVAVSLKVSHNSKTVAKCLKLSLTISHVTTSTVHTPQRNHFRYVHCRNDPMHPSQPIPYAPPTCPTLPHQASPHPSPPGLHQTVQASHSWLHPAHQIQPSILNLPT